MLEGVINTASLNLQILYILVLRAEIVTIFEPYTKPIHFFRMALSGFEYSYSLSILMVVPLNHQDSILRQHELTDIRHFLCV